MDRLLCVVLVIVGLSADFALISWLLQQEGLEENAP